MTIYDLVATMSDNRMMTFERTGRFFLALTLYVEKQNGRMIVRNRPY